MLAQGARYGRLLGAALQRWRHSWARASNGRAAVQPPALGTDDRPPRAPLDPQQALCFPLDFRSFDVGARYLFDFAVALSCLGVRPGARVLDFAAGIGWTSELLNRLDYQTVTSDIEATISLAGLTSGRYRLRFDMVNEHVCWFHTVGSPAIELPIEII
jgi:2-polyprenyl-3-methyl-5-hydroxy-6-metoxy-1,4-benzoquinol methylase